MAKGETFAEMRTLAFLIKESNQRAEITKPPLWQKSIEKSLWVNGSYLNLGGEKKYIEQIKIFHWMMIIFLCACVGRGGGGGSKGVYPQQAPSIIHQKLKRRWSERAHNRAIALSSHLGAAGEKLDGRSADLITGGVAWIRAGGWPPALKPGWKGQPWAPAKYFIAPRSCGGHDEEPRTDAPLVPREAFIIFVYFNVFFLARLCAFVK